MSASGVAITVNVEPRTDGDLVTFTAHGTNRSTDRTVAKDWLKDARVELSRHIADFKETVGSDPDPDLDDVRSALKRLHTVTGLLAARLAGGTAELRKLRAFFTDALPAWSSPADEIPLVWVDGPSEAFPFEWLPLLNLTYPAEVEDIELYARRFLGFSAVVRRAAPVPQPAGDRGLDVGRQIHNRPLPLTFAWFADLPGAQKEHDFFVRMKHHIDLNGPWPPAEIDSSAPVLETLFDILFDPRRRFDDRPDCGAIQIEHFACHADTGFTSSVDYELTLAGGDGVDRTLTIGELNDGFADRETGAGEATRPLVFLNGCESARLDAERVSSWPEWFLDNGHMGVIGTETLVPDEVAARYAETFYIELLSGRTLGEALVRARRLLLGRCGNPLGLLYVLYADPDMTVDNPVPREMLDV